MQDHGSSVSSEFSSDTEVEEQLSGIKIIFQSSFKKKLNSNVYTLLVIKVLYVVNFQLLEVLVDMLITITDIVKMISKWNRRLDHSNCEIHSN